MIDMTDELELIKQMDKNDSLIRESYKALQKKYPNEFIAIEKGKVVASGKGLKAVEQQLSKNVEKEAPVLIRYIPAAGISILY